jgi:hypothetical protein
MNTAVITPDALPGGRPIRHSTLAGRLLRRVGLALAGNRTAQQPLSREELAMLNERRREAEQLREANFRNVAFARLF